MGFAVHSAGVILGVLAALLQAQLPLIMAGCPLDLNGSNYTLLASTCSNPNDWGKCCRYINAFIAVIVARYTNATGDLGVASDSSDICLHSISQTFRLYGVPRDATEFCGLGTKISVNYECEGKKTITQMAQSPGFGAVTKDCAVPFMEKGDCRKCINASIIYLHGIIAEEDNVTLNTCRDATFAALASQADDASAAGFAGCFFHAPGLSKIVSTKSSSATPKASPTPLLAAGPSVVSVGLPLKESRHHYHLKLLPATGIALTALSLMLLVVAIFFIHRKSKEPDDPEGNIKTSMGATPCPPLPLLNIQDGPSFAFRKFTYKETKKSTKSFSTVIGQGGFGTVYKAEFSDGSVAAVKRMNRVSEQDEDEFCREIELVARLHHRHLVALKGFCIEKRERFLMYEYLENGSLEDHLHSPGRTSLSWQTRIQIAIDVANALEYLHFYCNPSLRHRDIKSSNILLDENFAAKVADFGLGLASNDDSVCLEPINTDAQGTLGYTDLTEKRDIYSYGVVVLELITARRATQDKKKLAEWSEPFLGSEARFIELVDPALGDNFDFQQLKTMVEIAGWCTQGEGRDMPSIKQVLRLLYESSDPVHSGFLQAVEDGVQETRGRGKNQRASSSSTATRSYCSRSFVIDNGGSPPDIPSV